jgi:hypothetical protein
LVSSPCPGNDYDFLPLGQDRLEVVGSLTDLGVIISKIRGKSGISTYYSHIYMGIRFGDHNVSGI